jgi:hypothetical protein
MLARVQAEPAGTFFWMQGWGRERDTYQAKSGTRLTGPERRALRDLDQGRALSLGTGTSFSGRDLGLAESGSALLSEWNDKHGNPLTEEPE